MIPRHATHTEMFGVYMDYQASTPLDPRVLEAMTPFLTGGFGNPHATDHGYGWHADNAISVARDEIAVLIGADSDEIIFTSGATEANNLAVLGAARAAVPNRRRILVSEIEHKCVLAAARVLADEGFEVLAIPVTAGGVVDMQSLRLLIDENTALVSIMTMNNEVGTVQPIEAIADICQHAGAMLHSDAAQALAVMDIDVDRLGIDLLSLSAHKAYGPKGIGALYVRRKIRSRIRPILYGGGQEDGLRPGTLPTFLCVGFGRACALLAEERLPEIERVASLRDRLLNHLLRSIPDLAVNGETAGRHPGNLNVRFPGLDADLVLAAVRPRLAAATGSACTSGTPEPSHVLRAMGLNGCEAGESIRLSLGRFTTLEDVDEAAIALIQATEDVRRGLA